MYKEKIVNTETGEETWRDYSPAEIAEVEAAQVEAAEKADQEAAAQTQKQAILNRLGLTADEAKLLLS